MLNQDSIKAERMHSLVLARRRSAKMLTLSVAIGNYKRRVEMLECRHRRLESSLACAVSCTCVFQGSSGFAL